eukprot:3584629-Rhodomonas_salina.1
MPLPAFLVQNCTGKVFFFALIAACSSITANAILRAGICGTSCTGQGSARLWFGFGAKSNAITLVRGTTLYWKGVFRLCCCCTPQSKPKKTPSPYSFVRGTRAMALLYLHELALQAAQHAEHTRSQYRGCVGAYAISVPGMRRSIRDLSTGHRLAGA